MEEKQERDRNIVFEIVNTRTSGLAFIDIAKTADDEYGIILDDVMDYINEFLRTGTFKISKQNLIRINSKYQ